MEFFEIFVSIFFSKFKRILQEIKKKPKNFGKFKTQGKNSMSRRIAPLLTSQVVLKKEPVLKGFKKNMYLVILL